MRCLAIALLVTLCVGSPAWADGVPAYGMLLAFEPWDEAQIFSKAPLVREVACKDGKAVNGLLPGDRIVKVGDYSMHNAIRAQFDMGRKILREAKGAIWVEVCRGKCRPITTTHRIRLEPLLLTADDNC